MNIRSIIGPVMDKISAAEQAALRMDDHIGTGLQLALEERISPLLPQGVGYRYVFDFSGGSSHVFFEKGNEQNQLIL